MRTKKRLGMRLVINTLLRMLGMKAEKVKLQWRHHRP
jgi:hypothetical protein